MEKRFFDCITEFIFLEHEPTRADVIFVPGGDHPDGARRAAALFAMGYAPYVLPSGRFSKLKGYFEEPGLKSDSHIQKASDSSSHSKDASLTGPETDSQTSNLAPGAAGVSSASGKRHHTEWEYFRDILLEEGVPEQAILKEDQATFTWENAIYSRRVLDALGIDVKKGIIVCQAFHARRCSMYYQQQFPEAELLVCPVRTKGITRDNWFLDEKKIDIVLTEVEHCGSQFHEIMKDRIRSFIM